LAKYLNLLVRQGKLEALIRKEEFGLQPKKQWKNLLRIGREKGSNENLKIDFYLISKNN